MDTFREGGSSIFPSNLPSGYNPVTGYPNSVIFGGQPTVSTLLMRDQQGSYPTGTYTILSEGQGK